MLHDVKHAFRMLLHTKGWTTVVRLAAAGDNHMRRSSSDYGYSQPQHRLDADFGGAFSRAPF